MSKYRSISDDSIERTIDAALDRVPMAPLPTGFTQRIMAPIQAESMVSISPSKSHQWRHWRPLIKSLWAMRSDFFAQLALVYKQLSYADVLTAIFFAALWCLLAGSMLWTGRFFAGGNLAQIQISPISMPMTQMDPGWLISICIAMGGVVVLGVLALSLYLEQLDN